MNIEVLRRLTISTRREVPVSRISRPSTMIERGMSAGLPTLLNWYCNCSGTPTWPVCELRLVATCPRTGPAASMSKAATVKRRGAEFMRRVILPVS